MDKDDDDDSNYNDGDNVKKTYYNCIENNDYKNE